ncbi:RNase adapter RapZ [Kitasatospora sp. NPDC004723]|uniref:RapZ C-terminal domain-containing protein n=1 Tax=Kitasatospora sp. NPDC004723 TaxID=3154288 RepID=UPI0033B488F2
MFPTSGNGEISEALELTQVVLHTIGLAHPGALDLIDNGLFYNLRTALPEVDGALAALTGLDPQVRERVLEAPGAMRIVEQIAESAKAVLDGYATARLRLVHVTIASRTGRHRSVALAETVAHYLATAGVRTETCHHDLDHPAGHGVDDLVTGPGDLA